MNRTQLKTKAKQAISGKVINIFAVFLVGSILLSVATAITFGLGSIFLTGAFMLASAFIFLGVATKKRTPDFGDLMYGLTAKTYMNGLVGYLRYAIFTALWSMLFVIPGIIKGISYSMMFFIMADDPKVDAATAQKKSMAMTNGHKLDLFVLGLSFLPWFFLVAITFGLAAIYVGPYMQTTYALYFEQLKAKK